MKRMLALLAACLCACAMLVAVGCSQPAQSSSASSETFEVKSDVVESAPAPVSTDPTYIMLIGNDSRWQTSEQGEATENGPTYSDTMMLMRIDPAENFVAICSVPRDTLITYKDEEAKVNDVHFYDGPEALATEVGKLFGVEVPYYFDLTFVQFAKLINNLGGVSVTVPKDMTGGDIIDGKDISLTAGDQVLDGNAALMLVRQRKLYSGDGEAIRQLLSRQLVANALQNGAARSDTDAASLAKLIVKAGKTNMSEVQLEAYIKAYMGNQPDPIWFQLGSAPYVTVQDANGKWGIALQPETFQALGNAMNNHESLTDIVPDPEIG